MTVLRASAPANLLLLGEYAVLEEGGLGLAIAVDVRGTASFTASTEGDRGAGSVTIEGIMPKQKVTWASGYGERNDEKLDAMATYLTTQYGTAVGTFSVDTCALFDNQGAKRGYGSSAVTASLLTALWQHAKASPKAEPATLIPTAVAVHRVAQGGHGSGYDVASSLVGGVIIFTGGRTPKAQHISLPWLKDLFLFAGASPVKTPGAVRHYEVWKRAHPAKASEFLGASNALVGDFATASTADAGLEIFRRYAALAEELGNTIGVPATIATPPGTPAEVSVKAIGAGNELGVAWDVGSRVAPGGSSGLERVRIAAEGLAWQ